MDDISPNLIHSKLIIRLWSVRCMYIFYLFTIKMCQGLAALLLLLYVTAELCCS